MSADGVLEPLEALTPHPDRGAAPRALALPWPARIADALASYLPLLILGLLALGSWWLVKNTAPPSAPRAAAAPRHEPDYTMQGFAVQRYTAQGALRAELDGATLRHFPDDGTLEVEQPKVRAYSADGSLTQASAERALANGDVSEVQLLGDARVTRTPSAAGEEPMSFRGEFLHAFIKTEQLRSHLPVTMTRGATVIRADSLFYDHLERTVSMKGRVRASFPPSLGRAGLPRPASAAGPKAERQS